MIRIHVCVCVSVCFLSVLFVLFCFLFCFFKWATLIICACFVLSYNIKFIVLYDFLCFCTQRTKLMSASSEAEAHVWDFKCW